MSGTVFDLSSLIYTEDGKIYQIEYANKCIENGESMVGIECKDGIVLAIEKKKISSLLEKDSNNRIFLVEKNIALMMTGKIPDGKNVLRRAMKEADNYKKNFGIKISIQLLAERIAMYVHAHTMYGGYRPLGCSIILAGVEDFNRQYGNLEENKKIFMINPSGDLMKFFGCSNGKNKIFTQGEIEKNKFKNLTIEESLPLISKLFLKSHEEVSEEYFELEIKLIRNSDDLMYEKLESEKVAELIEKAHELIDNE